MFYYNLNKNRKEELFFTKEGLGKESLQNFLYEIKPETKGGIKMGNRPIKKFRAGSIEAAIWLNEREVDGAIVGFKTVSLRRSWRDRDQNIWRDETINLRKGDLSKVLVVMQKAQEEILLNQNEKGGDDNE